MSYQVLARKWRPRTFHELVGQEHVRRALVNALDQGRLHHAYLFTGTRGVGKTTLARILAKCLNCEGGVTSSPCGHCGTCREIDEGRFVDLIEVDAASRTKVEDTRELLDNVQYAPTQGRYKVYLIDEVHMLSTHSFNALLKTLEEPPPHVKFLLATTDPQKLPVTVLSRCLQFTLKNMPPEHIVEHLTRVLEAEQVPCEESALWLLGRAADGSMRDALSLTDQAIAFGQGVVKRDDVAAMLGTLDHRYMLALVEALAEVDAARLLAEVANLAERGPDFAGVLDELVGVLHRLAVAQMVPNALDNSHGDREQILALAARMTAEDVQLYYQIGLQGRGDMDSAPDARTALEMTLLRMLAFRPLGVPKPPQSDLPLRGQGVSETVPEAEKTAPATEQSTRTNTSGASSLLETNNSEAPVAPSDTTAADISPNADPQSMDALDEGNIPPPWEPSANASEAAFVTNDGAGDEIHSEMPLEAHAEAIPVSEADSEPSIDSGMGGADASPTEPVATEETASEASRTVDSAIREEPSIVPACGFDHAAWLTLFPSLTLAGLTRNLAAHCMVEEDNGKLLRLRLAPSQAAMNAEVHVERIQKALAEADIQRRVIIEAGELPSDIETPKALSEREAAARHAKAVEALRGDPHIQQLEQVFGAQLLEQTVASQAPSE